ncbi:hypothetical protein A9X00_12890 [Mycobacterium sp. 1245805.9]|nr:hypothetical protein A9X00_12890 [Mycobacterium sp. 1245805.9]
MEFGANRGDNLPYVGFFFMSQAKPSFIKDQCIDDFKLTPLSEQRISPGWIRDFFERSDYRLQVTVHPFKSNESAAVILQRVKRELPKIGNPAD